jgi:hypothetical protein
MYKLLANEAFEIVEVAGQSQALAWDTPLIRPVVNADAPGGERGGTGISGRGSRRQ